jgi:Family of unknown function (DUF5996)
MLHNVADQPECWPALPLDSWKDTYATLHMWTQMVGKVRLRLTPLMNHWWNVPLYVTARGLTTSRIPYGQKAFELWFDFIRHQLVLETTDGAVRTVPLAPRSVAEFYEEFMRMLRSAGIEVKIWRMPVEVPNPIPFDRDREHRSYDPKSVERFWRILSSVDSVFNQFKSGFLGKCSPVHCFWEVSILRSPGFRVAELRSDRAPTQSREKRIRTKSAVLASGPAVATSKMLHSIPIWLPSGRDSKTRPSDQMPPIMKSNSASSCSCTRMYARPNRRRLHYSSFAKAHTKRGLVWAIGTVKRLKGEFLLCGCG